MEGRRRDRNHSPQIKKKNQYWIQWKVKKMDTYFPTPTK
jgi:hypothetical protein